MRQRLRSLARNPATWYTTALALTWPLEALLPPERLERLMAWSSTNIANLRPWGGHPLRALVLSAFVPEDSPGLWPLFALSVFTVVAALGRRRAVVVLALVHIGATLVTEALVWWRIHQGMLPVADAHTLDTGPSYLVVAAMAMAVGQARALWLRVLWAALLAIAAPNLLEGLTDGDYTAVGHVLAFAAGATALYIFHPRMNHTERYATG